MTDPDKPPPEPPASEEVRPTREGNRVFSKAESDTLWGEHPMAGWKYVPSGKGRRWMKPKP